MSATAKYIPALGWLADYRREWFRSDVLAGLTAAAIVIPKAMAYATIAGLPVEAGLYAASVPMLAYAVFGTSRVLSVSSTSTIAILVAAELAEVGGATSADAIRIVAVLSLLTGAFLLLAGILRLGFLANFISDPVLTGFKAGIGLVIVADQVPKLLGLRVHSAGFLATVQTVTSHLSEAHTATVLLGAGTLVLLFGMEHLLPRVPAPLAAIATGTVAFVILGLRSLGVAATGPIRAGLPVVVMPDWSLADALWPGALSIALMAYIESIAAGRAFVRQNSPRPVPDRELIALAAANAVAGLVGALPSGGGTSQTAVNFQSGARTQLAEIVTAGVTVATLVALGPVISQIPQVTLAAVVVATTIPLLAPREFVAIGRVRRTELVWALVAFAGVVFIGTLRGILVAVALSVLTLMHQANHPAVYAMGRKRGTDVFRPISSTHTDDEVFPGLLLARTEGRMTFASAPQMVLGLQTLVDQAAPGVVAVDCSAIPDIEYTALRMLVEFERQLRDRGVTLCLVALNPAALNVVRRSALAEALGSERMFFTMSGAVEAFHRGNTVSMAR